jgi:hypothetical protein
VHAPMRNTSAVFAGSSLLASTMFC